MRALRFDKFGDPSVLQVVETERPIPGAGEALVQVRAAGINPSDVKNVSGAMHQTKPPRIPGRDYAGVVVEGLPEWVGKEVWGASGQLGFVRDGTHAEFVVVPVDALSEKPALLSMEQAASVGIPIVTAYLSVVTRAGLKSGDTLLVVGGTGAVGSAAVRIGKWKGCRVIATTITDDNDPAWVSEVDVVVNVKRENLADAVKTATDGNGANIALNVVGGETFRASLDSLAKMGRLAVISAAAGKDVSFDLIEFYHSQLTLIGVDTLQLSDAESAQILTALAPGFQSRALITGPVTVVSLDEARDAYTKAGQGAGGKFVLRL